MRIHKILYYNLLYTYIYIYIVCLCLLAGGFADSRGFVRRMRFENQNA